MRTYITNPALNFLIPCKMTKKKNRFTAEEDVRLVELVNSHGAYEWNIIAGMMKNRTAKQCRERWNMKHAPGIVAKPWTVEEDQILLAKQAEIGNKWTEIARYLPGRTDLGVKNRWNSRHKANVAERTPPTDFGDPCSRSDHTTEFCIPPLLARPHQNGKEVDPATRK